MRHGLLGAITAVVGLAAAGWRIWRALSPDTRTEVKAVARDQAVAVTDVVKRVARQPLGFRRSMRWRASPKLLRS